MDKRVRTRASSLRERALATIASFYDAALDETRWAQALENLSRLTGSQAASFWVLDAASESSLLTFVSVNFDRRTIEEYLGGMAQVDPTVRHLLAHPNHSIVHDGMLGACRDEQSRRYLDWHERTVETRYRLVGQTRLSAQLQAGVALHRSRRCTLPACGKRAAAVPHRACARLAAGAALRQAIRRGKPTL